MKKRRNLKNLTLLLLGLLWVAGFGEVYLRIFGSRQFGRPGHSYVRPPYAYDEILGAPFRTNGFGLRGDDYESGTLRILAFGGSATESAEVAEAESWPARVEAHLNARYRAKIGQVANAGKAGLASSHYLAHLRELADPAGIDVAIMYTGANDADRIARYGKIQRIAKIDDATYGLALLQAFSQPDPYRLLKTAGDPISRRFLFPHFVKSFLVKGFVQPIRNRIEDLIPGRKLLEKRYRLRESPDYESVMARAADDYEHNLSLMLEIMRARSVTPLFISMPLFTEIRDSELAALNETLMNWCGREGVTCLDLASLPPPEGGRWNAPGSHHLTRQGADLAGRLIADTLVELLEGDSENGASLRKRARERGLPLPALAPRPHL